MDRLEWNEEPDPAPPASALRILALVTLLVALVVGAPLVAIDVLHPRDRIVHRGRIWRCALVGGSWPVEAPRLIGLQDGPRIEAIGAVEADRTWISVARLRPAAGGRTIDAAFVLGDAAGARLGGLDRTGRAVASVASSEAAGDHAPEIGGARECLHRRLPE